MSDLQERHELFERHLRGELNEAEMERLAEILDSDSSARKDFVEYAQWDTRFADVLRETGDERGPLGEPDIEESADESVAERAPSTRERTPTITATRVMLVIAALAVIASIGSYYFQRPSPERRIARITGMSGSLRWTGDGGQVVRDLNVELELPGGTIEALTPDSWFELSFKDGSTIAITGKTTLTFSDRGQKELHLKEGNLSCNVNRQPSGKPMLIHTQSAILEVLGTRFEVEVGLSSTMLSVSEGKVRVKRLSDGSTVEVSAGHRVIAAADRKMVPARVPASVNRWKSQLHRGPKGTYGKWSPATTRHAAKLTAIPYVPRENRSVTLYMIGLSVVRAGNSPVVVKPDSRFVVRGRLAAAADVYFGIGVANANGEFAGKFLARQPVARFKDDSTFEAVFHLSDFGLDPSVRDRKHELPVKPDGRLLTCVWSFTIYNKNVGHSGLEITQVELMPPGKKKSK